jgi:general secretion pathway protein E
MSSIQPRNTTKMPLDDPLGRFITFVDGKGAYNRDQLLAMYDISVEENVSFVQLLQKSGFGTEREILEQAAGVEGNNFLATLKKVKVDHTLIDEFGIDFYKLHNIFPVIDDGGSKGLVTSEPFDFDLRGLTAFLLGESLETIVCPSIEITNALLRLSPTERVKGIVGASEDELRDLAKQGPIIQFVQGMFTQAIEERASDIHFESKRTGLRTRFRINGTLRELDVGQNVEANAVISRLKYLAQLNISERRKPQDGRIRFSNQGKEIDLRLSILPTQHGQSAVVRVLDQSHLSLEWNALGFAKKDISTIKDLIHEPNGLFLVTGPTGSGKTTTLYTALNELNAPNCKIFTVEDPIEYSLEGVNQVQVNSDVGLSFASALRSILRQDPNVILIGEIRDAETAEMACRAALVGRLVLSTLHTNSAEQAVTRLKDLGVADYLIEATLKGVLGQTLELTQCQECLGKGCSACKGSGVGSRDLKYKLLKT